MADCRNQGMESPDRTQKTSLSSYFNRSVTFNSSSPSSAAAAEVTTKPLYNLYSTPAFQRAGSIKSLYSSPFGSMVSAGNSLKGKVRKLCSIFESPKQPPIPPASPSGKPSKLLLPASDSSNFFSNSKGIPSQDCQSIRMIFRGLRVNLDERDISMDAAYRKELQRVLGENNIVLPQVFIKGKYIGGADVIRQLLEAGELVRLIKDLPMRPLNPCDICDDVRFVPCSNCSGSRKVFDEDEEQAKRCTECNENGLVRCPLCSS